MRTLLLAVTFVLSVVAAALVAPALLSQERHDPTRRNFTEYRLRVGDQVHILVFNGKTTLTPALEYSFSVPGTGEVSLAPIGKMKMLDKTTTDVEKEVAQKLKDDNILGSPNVGCMVVEYAKRYAYLMGAVQNQIELPSEYNQRILEVLARSGGLGSRPGTASTMSSAGADLTRVRIRRYRADGTSYNFEVNVEDILERNKDEQNIVVFEGDIIYVPTLEGATPQSAEWVYVLGKVHGPGRHPIIRGRTPFTLTKLVAIVGDFTEFADRTKIKIIRTNETGRHPFIVDFDDIIDGKIPDFEIKADDLVYVPESWI